jgi:hypothetical protein
MPNENTEDYYADYEVSESTDISNIVNSRTSYRWVDRMSYSIKKWVVGMGAAAMLLGAVATTDVACGYKTSKPAAGASMTVKGGKSARSSGPTDAGVRDTFKDAAYGDAVYGSNTNPEAGTATRAPSTNAPYTPTTPITPKKAKAPEKKQETEKGDLELRVNMRVDSTRFASNTAKKNIDKFVRDAYKAGKKTIYVAGFASIEGPSDKNKPVKNTDPYNEKLSELRSEKVGSLVEKYLVKKGLKMKVLQIHYGETEAFGGLSENRTVALSTREIEDPNESKAGEAAAAGMPAEVVYDTAKAPKGEVTIDSSKVKVYKLKKGKAEQSRIAASKQQAAESRLEKATIQPAATQEPQLPDSAVQRIRRQEAKVAQFAQEAVVLERLGDKYNRLRALHSRECRPGTVKNTICDTKEYGIYCKGGEPKSLRGEPAACTYLYKDLLKMYTELQSKAKSQTQRLIEVQKETQEVQKLMQQYRKAAEQRKSAPQKDAPSQNYVPDHKIIERDDGVIIKFHNPTKSARSATTGGVSYLDRCSSGVYQYSHLLDQYMGKCGNQDSGYRKSA